MGRIAVIGDVGRHPRHLREFTGVDPKHGRTGATRWQPLVLDGADVLVGRIVACT